MQRIVREKQRRNGENRAKSAFQNECQYDLAVSEKGSYCELVEARLVYLFVLPLPF